MICEAAHWRLTIAFASATYNSPALHPRPALSGCRPLSVQQYSLALLTFPTLLVQTPS